MTTKYEFIDGIWHVILEDADANAIEAEISRLRAANNMVFIGPHKVGNRYAAKGMVLQ